MITTQQIFFGTRIPLKLREGVARFCREHGIKMTHFVTKALKDKLAEMREDAEDIRMAEERMKDAEYLSAREMGAYFKKRLSGQ
jgi:hypothetical protein